MARIDIEGQFNIDRAACSDSQPFRLERQPSTISTTRIRNWNNFCDAIDQVLMPATRLKTQAKFANALLFIFIIAVVLVINLLPRLLLDFDYGLLKYSFVLVYPIILVYAYVYCRVRRKLVAIMEKGKEVCESHCMRGVTYRLESEHWGGCNKPHVKRYYITVEIMDEEDDNVDNDIEQQNHAADTTVSDYFSTTTFKQETAATTTTSLADMLK